MQWTIVLNVTGQPVLRLSLRCGCGAMDLRLVVTNSVGETVMMRMMSAAAIAESAVAPISGLWVVVGEWRKSRQCVANIRASKQSNVELYRRKWQTF